MKNVMKMLLALSLVVAVPVSAHVDDETTREVVVAGPSAKPVQKRLGKSATKAVVAVGALVVAAATVGVGYKNDVHGKVGQWWNKKPAEGASKVATAETAPTGTAAGTVQNPVIVNETGTPVPATQAQNAPNMTTAEAPAGNVEVSTQDKNDTLIGRVTRSGRRAVAAAATAVTRTYSRVTAPENRAKAGEIISDAASTVAHGALVAARVTTRAFTGAIASVSAPAPVPAPAPAPAPKRTRSRAQVQVPAEAPVAKVPKTIAQEYKEHEAKQTKAALAFGQAAGSGRVTRSSTRAK